MEKKKRGQSDDRSCGLQVSHLGLAEIKDTIIFRFIDPLFAWACSDRRLTQQGLLHFEHIEHLHPTTTEPLYGASVANGKIMRQAVFYQILPTILHF